MSSQWFEPSSHTHSCHFWAHIQNSTKHSSEKQHHTCQRLKMTPMCSGVTDGPSNVTVGAPASTGYTDTDTKMTTASSRQDAYFFQRRAREKKGFITSILQLTLGHNPRHRHQREPTNTHTHTHTHTQSVARTLSGGGCVFFSWSCSCTFFSLWRFRPAPPKARQNNNQRTQIEQHAQCTMWWRR